MFVSPTEPGVLQALGEVSSLPELNGCDFVWTGPDGMVGVQRKEVTDLVASLFDGRLAAEVASMRFLAVRILLVEGRLRWSPSGRLTTVRRAVTREQLRGVLLSAQQRGLWVVHTDDLADTAVELRHLHRWIAKRRHTAFDPPAALVPPVGTKTWGVHLLQAFPRVGPVIADAIWERFGRVPLRWDCTVADLAAVRGVGPIRAAGLLTAFDAEVEEGVA